MPRSEPSLSSKAPRRYGFACSACNRKKIRCDGDKPACRRCRTRGETCTYKIAEHDPQIRDKLQDAQDRIHVLEEQLRSFVGADSPRADRMTEASHASVNETPDRSAEHCSELSLDENGQIQCFGATSRFYMPTEERAPTNPRRRQGIDEQYHRAWFRVNSKLHRSLEKLAFANLRNNSSMDIDLSSELLQIYWTWQHPLHNCVYRRCFLRDMALGGQYFSPFLLNVIYAHAARHIDSRDPRFKDIGHGEAFLAKAKLLLQAEMEQPQPAIATIQGLLILGGRQCSQGHNSQGWLYTGMAIRMMKDIGLHLSPKKLNHPERMLPDEFEARKRLFLSAYVWDKTISICLGRPPSLVDMPFPADCLWDYSDDEEDWKPCSLLEFEHDYPLTKSLNSSTFANFCKLSEIINESYGVVYNGAITASTILQKLNRLEEKLRSFYQGLPDKIRIEEPCKLDFCPPPHIFSLNVLYHVVIILLYRPFLFSTHLQSGHLNLTETARKVCVEESAIINHFINLHGKTFRFKNQTYLVSYCVYTAATIDAHELKFSDDAGSDAAAERLSSALQMLESEASQTPGIRRSIDIIKLHLRTHFQARQLEPTPVAPSVADSSGVNLQPQAASMNYMETDTTALSALDRRGIGFETSERLPQATEHSLLSPAESGSGQLATSPAQRPRQPRSSGPQRTSHPEPSSAHESRRPWAADDLGLDLSDMVFGNVGGGFVPSSLNWTAQDTSFDFNMFTTEAIFDA